MSERANDKGQDKGYTEKANKLTIEWMDETKETTQRNRLTVRDTDRRTSLETSTGAK